jgi:hypothetical protein
MSQLFLSPPRDQFFWKNFLPLKPFDHWVGLFPATNDGVRNLLVNDRKLTEDAFYELPTLETVECLQIVLSGLYSGPILSVGSGIALIEKLLIETHQLPIICTDEFPESTDYFNRKKDAQQMEVENLSYEDAVKKYNTSKIVFSCWVPNNLNITTLLLAANPDIEVFVFIGEPNIDESKSMESDNVTLGEMEGKSQGGSTGCPEMYDLDGWGLESVYPKSISQSDRPPKKMHHTQIDIFYKKVSYPKFTGDAMVDFPLLQKEWMDPAGSYSIDFADVLDEIMSADTSNNPQAREMQTMAMMEMMKMTGMITDENENIDKENPLSSMPDMNGCPMQ